MIMCVPIFPRARGCYSQQVVSRATVTHEISESAEEEKSEKSRPPLTGVDQGVYVASSISESERSSLKSQVSAIAEISRCSAANQSHATQLQPNRARAHRLLLCRKVCRIFRLSIKIVGDGKFQIDKFDGTNFSWWRMQIEDLLVQKDLDAMLGDKPEKLSDAEWAGSDRKAVSVIRLSLTKNVAFSILTVLQISLRNPH